MANRRILTDTPAAEYAAFNVFLCTLFGDDPGSVEIPVPQCYREGEDDTLATDSLGSFQASQANTNTIAAYVAAHPAIRMKDYPAKPPVDAWAEAYALWGLLPVQPEV